VVRLSSTTAKAPRAGRQKTESSQPEPEPEPGGGDPRYHAFHSYHYSAGDGRRQRGAAAARTRLGRRSINFEEDTSTEDGGGEAIPTAQWRRDQRRASNGQSRSVSGNRRSTSSSVDHRSPSSGSTRLARHIRVVSPDDVATGFSTGGSGSLDFERQAAAAWEDSNQGRICLSTESFLSGLLVLVAVLIVMMSVLGVYCIKDRKETLLKLDKYV
jgi:hypothetical protein